MVPDKQQKIEIYIMNGIIVFRLLSDPMLTKKGDKGGGGLKLQIMRRHGL